MKLGTSLVKILALSFGRRSGQGGVLGIQANLVYNAVLWTTHIEKCKQYIQMYLLSLLDMISIRKVIRNHFGSRLATKSQQSEQRPHIALDENYSNSVMLNRA